MNERRDLQRDPGLVMDDAETVPTISREDRSQAQENAALFSDSMLTGLRQRWDDIQAGFVDDPKSAVENADRLVEETVRRLVETFARERTNLETSWSRGEQASTEDLRIALQRYRSFFNRLLST